MKDGEALFPANGKLYKYDVTNTSAAEPVDLENVAITDGWEEPRLLIAVNDQFPGPAIEVYQGQTVVVHVTNSLPSDSMTIHWHGLPQVGTPWMDGVSFLTQCPFLPGQTFTYRFKASHKGTYWYHSHIGMMRSMGNYGPLIIREKKPLRMKEFIMLLTEWNHDWDSNLAQLKEEDGMFINRTEIKETHSLDGAKFSLFNFHSVLVNGKGRYFSETGDNGAPLENFSVDKRNDYVFRIIAAGVQVPFRFSIDNHDITVIASDGYDLDPYTAESLIIHPGERYDVQISASADISNYWIRIVSVEADVERFGLAILKYKGATGVEPTTSKRLCTAQNKCRVVNCPFLHYPQSQNIECVTFDQLKNKVEDKAPNGPLEEDQEFFLNFAFPGLAWIPGSVNGRTFRKPVVSALTQPQEIEIECKDDCGEEKVCQCPYSIDLHHGKTYQMVFLNMGIGKGFSHPIHMHGHSFYVLKMGYGSYNATTGKIIGDNLDIDCRGHLDREKSFCNDATWTNPSWLGGNVPGLELKNPPRKDTIIVPTGGYVVVRIKADNPGVWFMHCHIELHTMDGMAVMLNESFDMHPPPPEGFPTCGNFDYSRPAPMRMPSSSTPKPHDEEKNEGPGYSKYDRYGGELGNFFKN
ncbi:hypothetical protein LOTGIDRAFT_124263 [Lottia gigantea]|uniref:Laccase n=1 Tax=Lottia gigantea TaxID=225164 RepID=V4A9F4_LOTGI|nr:hypothetical protein LOTGIDRAFT_124263 [Lottia gigantea]ESO89911.1 hypothetical protein LOTGIDRAFT_124263 [Lottia gigantea]